MAGESAVTTAPADFGARFSAFVIDAALLVGVQWIVFIVLSRQLQAVGLTQQEPCTVDANLICEGPSDAVWVVLIAALVATTFGYHAVFEGLRGATPGKHRMGLAVVTTDGASPIGLGRGLVRSLVRQSVWLALFLVLEVSPISLSVGSELFFLIPAVPLAGLVWGAFAPSGRSAHDWFAATTVVTADSLGVAQDDLARADIEDSP